MMNAVVVSMIFTAAGLFWFGLVALFSSLGYTCPKDNPALSRWRSFMGSLLAMMVGWLIWSMRDSLKEWGESLSKIPMPRTQWHVKGEVDADAHNGEFAKDVHVWMGWIVSIAGGMAIVYPILVGWILVKLVIPISGLHVGPVQIDGQCQSTNFLGDLVDVMQPVTSIFIFWIAVLGVLLVFSIFQWNHFTGLSHTTKESFLKRLFSVKAKEEIQEDEGDESEHPWWPDSNDEELPGFPEDAAHALEEVRP